jgi:RNA polymerase sigma-70 factor (ECF subfamily)
MRDLVKAAQQGDREAFAGLAFAEANDLYAVAYRIVRDPHLAQDALQAALAQAWRRLPSLQDPSRFSAWVLRLLVAACIDAARGVWTADVRSLPDGPEPPNESLSSDDRAQLDGAFRRLPAEHRAAFVLHHFVGLTSEEIAEMLAIAPGIAGSRLHEATRALRASLDGADTAVATATGQA